MWSNKKLTKLLEIGFADNSERTKIFDKSSTQAILKLDNKSYKALLQSEASNTATLVQEEVYRQISEGAEPWKVLRNILPIIRTDTYSVRVLKGETGTYAEELAEAANIPIDNQIYTKEDISIYKIGTRPLITNELVEDCLWDIISLELSKAGARMENKLNRDCLLEILLDTTTISDLDPEGTHLAVTDIAKARADVESQNYQPNTIIMHPSAEGYLLQDSNLVYAAWAGSPQSLHTATIPKIMGLTPYTLSVTTGDTGHVWGATDLANNYNGIIMDSAAHTYLAMRRDLQVEQYDDPIHDIVGMACTMRFGVGTIQAASGILILTK